MVRLSTTTNGACHFGMAVELKAINSAITAGGSGAISFQNASGTSPVICLVNANISSTSGAITAIAGNNVTLNNAQHRYHGAISLTATNGAVAEARYWCSH